MYMYVLLADFIYLILLEVFLKWCLLDLDGCALVQDIVVPLSLVQPSQQVRQAILDTLGLGEGAL